ncbi:hypothetical protein GIB67_036284 [Kingdonia uniflora]|uniref:Uncharacterized protein n=1 Tax=Kingdonia uniflora TaxID=39325 RepID=A0A7J7L3T1_9MAGN|nr:hypothetical protein GIB67_036284 [Kingdonia uniflora]
MAKWLESSMMKLVDVEKPNFEALVTDGDGRLEKSEDVGEFKVLRPGGSLIHEIVEEINALKSKHLWEDRDGSPEDVINMSEDQSKVCGRDWQRRKGEDAAIKREKDWVSNGVVGSPAFAAFDQGYDVFLGNLRGLVSREHIDKKLSSRQYWRYSINEHGTQDIPAIIEKIHQVKTFELKNTQPDLDDEIVEDQPYKICAICHSLGGAAILMYLITRRIEDKPHRLSRLILLSPAGFHDDSSFAFTAVQYLVLFLAPILAPIFPGLYIPTKFFRMLLNKLARDFQNYPALGGLVQTLMSYVVGGDSSNWVGVIGTPHYNMNDMPGVSFYVALHLSQMKRAGKFIMYDYGSKRANMEVYGSTEPLDLGEYYGLIDVPVDLVAGHKDKVIRPTMVRKHYKVMKDSGVDVSYSEFEYAHLDFTFSHREELLSYVMSRLLLVAPQPNQQNFKKVAKVKRRDVNRITAMTSFSS